ncbi:ATP-dependent nuclease, partial [Xanthobacter sediminis]|uniref:ATP-dependent nuclease n=1 Tax=Xanthobacter sediminis TaxID=3119926 RepID=UPI00372B49DB
MKLIKRIEINYLRSLYDAALNKIGDLNVIFGRNDSGKSNLLRALNLFFNNQIDPGQHLAFDLDMSDRRKQEARDAKGKQIIWIKINFELPSNYKKALGSEISIKRQWNRDGGMSETVFPAMDTPGKQARLTRFMNDIDFTYIPAIKDLNVYADLIERMYGAASETEILRNATTQFVQAIAGQTASLSQQLTDLFGAPAALAPPTEMSRLFRNLDFAHGTDGHSMLRQKGDGIKARHLPELIRFINEKESRKKIFLWGFEEPENSLDLGAAEIEAKRFAAFATRPDTQVFVTSHSPAFYLANTDYEDGTVRRYFITKQIPDEKGVMEPSNAATMIDDISEAERRMEQAGLLQLPFVIRQLGVQRDALREKEKEAEFLRAEIQKLRTPTLFVEGKHDVAIFEQSLERLKLNDRIGVKPLSGTPQTTEALLSAILEQGGLSPSAKTLFLFDDDKSGRGAARKLVGSA